MEVRPKLKDDMGTLEEIISGKGGTQRMEEGLEEKDIMEVVFCRGFKKLLNMKDCNEKCRYFFGIFEEPVMVREGEGEIKQVGVERSVRCGIPRLSQIAKVCEVDDAQTTKG